MPPAGAIMTAAEDDDNLGNARTPGPGKGGGRILEVDAVCHPHWHVRPR
jgi:hypothetical protein